ncbi:outer membrane beta-barrel protein [Corallococcus sp. AS-1-12]|uniref:outer membrane beta-barrel protein n=1 Tax=Corallococcus sp. AS-1-12 TaxID=2874598 RepID=UPI001CC0567B|nr:outer membrane beta-barrel protein [Corallococcus sp. AS-1-12]MBZ4330397.1 outer membrane beta-barrel protein [Corallococcus sp. AS-1-12]
MNALALLAAAALAAAPASKKDTGGPLFIAPKVGFIKPVTSLGGDLFLGGEVGYLTPLLQRRLALVLEVNYHRPSTSGTLRGPQLDNLGQPIESPYTLAEREVAIQLSAVFRFPRALGPLTPYVGAGPGLYLHRATVESFDSTTSESGSGPGFQVLAGAELPLGPGGAFLEAKYHFARVDFLTTGSVNAGAVLAALGYRLRL